MSPKARERLAEAALVTGNPGKLAEARRLCGADLEVVELDLTEIQSSDIHQVLQAKAEDAFARLVRPLVVEETGLELAALNGFPGALVKWLLAAVGAEGIARMVVSLGDTRATARCALLYRDPHRSVSAEGITPGRLVLPPRGEGGFGWDPVFQPDNCEQTYAEMTGTQKDRISHRGNAWRQLVELLGDL